MIKEIYKEDYFGTLMAILIDEARKIMPTFNPTPELHKIQLDRYDTARHNNTDSATGLCGKATAVNGYRI